MERLLQGSNFLLLPRRRKPAFVTHDNEASLCDSGVSGSKQIEGCCTIILITKENPDGFFFAGSLHGCVDRTMKRP